MAAANWNGICSQRTLLFSFVSLVFCSLRIFVQAFRYDSFETTGTIPQFETSNLLTCLGDGFVLCSSSREDQLRDLLFQFSVGTYPTSTSEILTQHIRHPLVALETMPHIPYQSCEQLESASSSFLIGAVLHSVIIGTEIPKEYDIQGWSFSPLQLTHQKPFDFSVVETVTGNSFLSMSVVKSPISLGMSDVVVVPNSSLWFVHLRKWEEPPRFVTFKFFVVTSGEQLLSGDTFGHTNFILMRHSPLSQNGSPLGHHHAYLSWYPFVFRDNLKEQTVLWNYSQELDENEFAQVQSWNLRNGWQVGRLSLTVLTESRPWNEMSVVLSVGYATVPPVIDKLDRKLWEIGVSSIATLVTMGLIWYYCYYQSKQSSTSTESYYSARIERSSIRAEEISPLVTPTSMFVPYMQERNATKSVIVSS